MLVISGSKSKDQAGLGLYSLDSSSELRIFKSHHGFRCRRGLDSRMGIGFKEIYLGNSHGVGQSGVVFHFPKSPKSVSTLAYSSGCFTPICSYTPMCRYILRGAQLMCILLSPEADKLPAHSGNRRCQEQSGREEPFGAKERSEMGVRCGEAGDESIRDELQGWHPDRNQRWRNQTSGRDWKVTWIRQRWERLLNQSREAFYPTSNDSWPWLLPPCTITPKQPSSALVPCWE